MPYSQAKAVELGLAAAASTDVSPEKAVRLVKAILAAAALNGGSVEAKINIIASTEGEVTKTAGANASGLPCVVKAEVCLPIVGCHCICIVPPGGDC